MEDPFGHDQKTRRRRHLLLRLDSWIDSTLWSAGIGLGDKWEDLNIFFRRFTVKRWKRVFFELAGEAMTWGTAGAVLMVALALPAFDETYGNWRAQDDFAVTFLDRYGTEIGHRGIIHEDSVPIDELPDHLIKSVLATEDRRFFEHFGIDVFGLVRAMTENVRANSVVQGGSTITQQLAKNLFLTNEKTLERKIKEAFPGAVARGQSVQGRNPATLPRPGLHGRRHVWRSGGGAILFRQGCHRRHPRRIGHAGRPVQGPGPIRATHQPAGGPWPRQRGADKPCPGQVDDRGDR